MKLKCLKNKNAHIKPLVLPFDYTVPMNDDNFVVADLESSGGRIGYALTVDRTYAVYAILRFLGETRYLIQDDDNLPMFHSSDLFEVSDDRMNFDWGRNSYFIEGAILEIVGYSDIVDYSGLIKLLSRDPKSIRTFLDYKDKQ